ncbi:uncharacterized protein PG986_006852 [Apiospora aurea]|uniref:Uncharacterized protein n=1 Tax=Apiospora aurea TaxID=335848 RepID=A0ABR1QAY9_9PEZI
MRASLVRNLAGLQARYLRAPAIHSARRTFHQLSIAIIGRPSKGAVLDSLKGQLKGSGHPGRSVSNGASQDGDQLAQQSTAVILASPELASWSEDQGFMSQLLGTLHQERPRGDASATSAAGESHTDVLFGVVDGIADPYRLHSKPHQGLSIIYGGTASLLPSLWEQGKIAGKGYPDRASAVQFTAHEAENIDGQEVPTPVTLPLANTLFQNGRRSTLFASRWSLASSASASGHRPMELTRLEEKSHQEVACLRGLEGLPVRIPLVPIAPPRKIVTGLGNIVRQVEVDGVVSPASKELEALIPRLFEKRAAAWLAGDGTGQAPSPMGVWAWVMPAWTVDKMRYDTAFKTYLGNQDAEEWRLDVEAREIYGELLVAECRMHKILSGGGGWGAKQGLLSLDPETTYAAPEQDDMDVFIKAFEERNNSASQSSSDGIVTPGSYMMFCAEPDRSGDVPSSSVDPASDLVSSRLTLTVAPKGEDVLPNVEGAADPKGGQDRGQRSGRSLRCCVEHWAVPEEPLSSRQLDDQDRCSLQRHVVGLDSPDPLDD